MLDARITEFVAAWQSADLVPRTIVFSAVNKPTERYPFVIARRFLYYSPHIKIFDSIVRRYLRGEVNLAVEANPAMIEPRAMYLDFQHVVTDAVRQVPISDVEALFEDESMLQAERLRAQESVPHFFLNDLVDNIVLFYFHHHPKPLVTFFGDFPAVDRNSYRRSMLGLAMLGFLRLQLRSVEPVVVRVSRPVEVRQVTESSPNVEPKRPPVVAATVRASETKPSNSQLEGLQKLLKFAKRF